MATKKPVRRMVTTSANPSGTLMGNQDTRRKGDSTGGRKKEKCITFWVTEEQKLEIGAYAAAHNTTVSRLIIEGLEMRMKE